jgi:hypothetical protein
MGEPREDTTGDDIDPAVVECACAAGHAPEKWITLFRAERRAAEREARRLRVRRWKSRR